MSKLVPVLAVVVVIAVAGAGAAIFLLNNQDKTPTATILVEDQDGIYFWMEGKGETLMDALKKPSAGVTVTIDGQMVNGFNGLLAKETATAWLYWSLYYLDGTEWKYSDVGASELKVSEHPTVGFFYASMDKTTYETTGGPDSVTVPSVEDKKVWNGSTSGTVFAITSHTGMYFYINSSASGTMADRFKAATDDYKIPFEPSKSGIKTLFGKGTVQMGEDYLYWNQFCIEDNAWVKTPKTFPNIENADDYKQIAVVYAISSMTTGIDTPLPPIYSA